MLVNLYKYRETSRKSWLFNQASIFRFNKCYTTVGYELAHIQVCCAEYMLLVLKFNQDQRHKIHAFVKMTSIAYITSDSVTGKQVFM